MNCKPIWGRLFPLVGGAIAIFCICQNYKMYLSKLKNVFSNLQNVFVQIEKCICPNDTMYLFIISNRFVACCLPLLVAPMQFSILQSRAWQEFSFSKILVKISFIFSRPTLRNPFLFLLLVSKHEIDRQIFSFLSRITRLKESYSRSLLVKKLDFH